MRASNSSSISPLAARSLQLVGTIMIVSFALDALTLLFPPNVTQVSWRLGFTSQVIDRGVIPLVGLAFVLAGLWISSMATESGLDSPVENLLKTGSVILAAVLGVTFLLIAPIHAADTIRSRNQAMRTIEQQASQAETRLSSSQFESGLERRQNQFKSQIEQLINSPQDFERVVSQAPAQQADLLRGFKQDPNALNEYIQRQATNLPKEARKQIRERKMQAEKQTQERAVKSIARSFSSGLLAIGYLGIGWTGLTGGMSGGRKRRRKAAGL
ncbi:MAG: HpsJ family protein [Hormoscilla sp.]